LETFGERELRQTTISAPVNNTIPAEDLEIAFSISLEIKCRKKIFGDYQVWILTSGGLSPNDDPPSTLREDALQAVTEYSDKLGTLLMAFSVTWCLRADTIP